MSIQNELDLIGVDVADLPTAGFNAGEKGFLRRAVTKANDRLATTVNEANSKWMAQPERSDQGIPCPCMGTSWLCVLIAIMCRQCID